MAFAPSSFRPDVCRGGAQRLARVAFVLTVLALPAWGQAQPPAPARSTASSAALPRVAAPAQWSQLSPQQQQALQPLAGQWDRLSDTQRRKWLNLSQNYARMSPTEQGRLHNRMRDWATLSTRERQQARLNFAIAKDLTPEQRRQQWQAYQALSPEERQKLAAGAPRKAPGAATAVQPVAPQKLAKVPRTPGKTTSPAPLAAAPGRIDPHTLLPQSTDDPAAAGH